MATAPHLTPEKLEIAPQPSPTKLAMDPIIISMKLTFSQVKVVEPQLLL